MPYISASYLTSSKHIHEELVYVLLYLRSYLMLIYFLVVTLFKFIFCILLVFVVWNPVIINYQNSLNSISKSWFIIRFSLCCIIILLYHELFSLCLLFKVNSLIPGRSRMDFEYAFFNVVLLIGIFKSFNDNSLRCMSQHLVITQHWPR